jgi:Methylamine utilisation protein MauE
MLGLVTPMNAFDWLYKLCRWGLGIVFIYAGCAKLLEPRTFAVLIEAYGILPQVLLMPAAVVLPALEVAGGIALLWEIEGSLAVIAGLLLLFVAILGYGIRLGLDVDCGCFGPDDPEAKAFRGLRESLYRDLAMLAGIGFMYGWRRYRTIQPVKITLMIRKLGKKRRKEDAYI